MDALVFHTAANDALCIGHTVPDLFIYLFICILHPELIIGKLSAVTEIPFLSYKCCFELYT